MPKIATIIGARPQFIKCAPVSREIRKEFVEVIIHTGQHYDQNMSQAFFEELDIPEPDFNLGIGSGNHGLQTGKMLMEIEKVLINVKPDIVLVYGDTNSTMAGALAAVKLHIPVAHIEAGLRSFNRKMPEEINRIVTDLVSKYLFAPTQTAVNHLQNEGHSGIYLVGDVMYDSFLYNIQKAKNIDILNKLGIQPKSYFLATIHRPQNTDDFQQLNDLLSSLGNLNKTIIFPIHPRTKNKLKDFSIQINYKNLYLIEPVTYLEMIYLENNSELIITDSGGVQKESYFAGIPCIVLRGETEWVELVENGWALLVGNQFGKLPETITGLSTFKPMADKPFGDGHASRKIADILNGNKTIDISKTQM